MNERDDDLMRRFLVDDLTDEQREAVERRFMDDAEFFEQLASLEHEMMVDLIQGRLPARWAAPLAKAVAAAPDRQRRLEETRSLLEALSEHGERQDQAGWAYSRWIAVAASLILLIGAAAMWRQHREPIGAITASPSPAAPDAPEPVAHTALLRPGPARSASESLNHVRIAADVSRLRLVSEFDAPASGPVQAHMRAVGGAVLDLPSATEQRLTGVRLEVIWELPASAVAAGDYLITYSVADAGSRTVLGTRFVRITK